MLIALYIAAYIFVGVIVSFAVYDHIDCCDTCLSVWSGILWPVALVVLLAAGTYHVFDWLASTGRRRRRREALRMAQDDKPLN